MEARLKELAIENDDNVFIEDLRVHERTLREKLEYVKGKRDSLGGLMEDLKKVILEF